MDKKERIAIIGAGFGGLSAAALLAKEGYNITIYEKNDRPGGRARVFKEKGFKFDMGPSWYLMPDVFETFFGEFDKSPSDYFELVRLNPAYKMIFGKGDEITISSNLEENFKLFDQIENNGAEKMRKYLKLAKFQYEVSINEILYKNINSIFTLMRPKLLVKGLKLNIFSNLKSKIDKIFESERMKKILLYSVVFLGGDPKNTPAIYSLMSHVDFNMGVWYPKGGIGVVVEALVKLSEKYGAQIEYNKEINQILVENKTVKGVKIGDQEIYYDRVIVNADYHHVESILLEEKYRSYNKKYWDKKIIAPSAYLIYLGLNTKIPEIEHHTLVLDNDWENHFREIFEEPGWPKNPSYYVCNPSKTDDTVAPPNKENLFILVPVAPGLKDSDEIRNMYFDKMITHLEDLTNRKIREEIEVKRIFSHRDFIKDYNAYKGTALGLSHTLFQSVMFRPKHKSKKIKNLYYTGQYNHPGIGVPMVLISSTIVRDLIKKDRKRSKN